MLQFVWMSPRITRVKRFLNQQTLPRWLLHAVNNDRLYGIISIRNMVEDMIWAVYEPYYVLTMSWKKHTFAMLCVCYFPFRYTFENNCKSSISWWSTKTIFGIELVETSMMTEKVSVSMVSKHVQQTVYSNKQVSCSDMEISTSRNRKGFRTTSVCILSLVSPTVLISWQLYLYGGPKISS